MQGNEYVLKSQRALTDYFISRLNEPVTPQEIDNWIIEIRKAEIKWKYASKH